MQIDPTPYKDINELLSLILSQLQTILGHKLLGLYLFGSLVAGDFQYETSDIDLVAAISSDLDEKEFERLKFMHGDILNHNKKWDDRLEIGYIAVENLKKSQSLHTIALISPGEPFNVKETGPDWIINRYVLREKGLALYGPSPKTIIAPISREELMQSIQDNIKEWREWLTNRPNTIMPLAESIPPRKYQAHAILTMCREIYRSNHDGKVVSKKEAAQWTEKEFPEWSSLIQNALVWREEWRNRQVDHEATLQETLRFVHFALSQCESGPGISKSNPLL